MVKTLINCSFCNLSMSRERSQCTRGKRNLKNSFCSPTCCGKYQAKRQDVNCGNCNKLFTKRLCEIKRSKSHFCSQSCAATYNNRHKTYGGKRSKLEKYIEKQLVNFFPTLEIIFNGKKTIKSELDIYIPNFKLAIEISGIHHFKPIYGEKIFNCVQRNDLLKVEACNRRSITLVIINTSHQKIVTPKSSEEFLLTVKELIESYQVI